MDHPRPTILFVHGYLESSDIWTEFVRELPDTYQVLCPNLPGYGPQPGQVGDYSLEAAADFLRQQLLEAGVGRALLVGHSMGGFVALAFAEKYPGLVAGLCLFHSTALPDADEDHERRERNRAFIEQHGVAAFADEFLQPQLAPAHRESMAHHVEKLKHIASAVPLEAALGSLDAIAQRPDRRTVLEKATYPVLFIAGKDDRAVPPEKTHEESLLPDHSMVLWLANVGHLGFLERPDATRRAVEGFAELVFRQ